MSKKEYIDFKKEFKEFAKDLENSKPIFDDDNLSFDDFDNLFGEGNLSFDDFDSHFNDDIGDNGSLNNDFDERNLNIDDFDDLNDLFNDCPEISLETDDMLMDLRIKKDYSKIKDPDLRKKEFFKDLRDFIDEFESTEESNELMKFYDE